MLKESRKDTAAILVLFTFFIGLFVYASVLYTDRTRAILEQETIRYLTDKGHQEAAYVRHHTADILDDVTLAANFVARFEDIQSQQTLNMLSGNVNSEADRISVALPDGSLKSNDGLKAHISDRDYFQKALRGEANISQMFVSRFVNKKTVIAAAPIKRGEKIVGVLCASFYEDSFSELFISNIFDKYSYFYIADADGNVLIPPKTEIPHITDGNIFTNNRLSAGRQPEETSLADALKGGASGSVAYRLDGEERYMAYVPIGINCWYILSVIPHSAAADRFSDFAELPYAIAILVAVAFLCIAAILAIFYNRHLDQLEKAVDALTISEERYKLVAENTAAYVIDWNVDTGAYYTSPSYESRFGRLQAEKSIVEIFRKTEKVSPEDGERLAAFASEILSSKRSGELDFRMHDVNGSYVWCRITATSFTDRKGRVQRIIATINDIDSEYLEKQELIKQATTDDLTGLFDKGATQNAVTECLKNESDKEHALFIIDIDNFKKINDTYGHTYGDAVLGEVGEMMKKLFRASDITGRTGGDEFMVLLRNASTNELICRKAMELRDMFRSCTGDHEHSRGLVSGSIGIAVYPRDATDFADLYRKADAALYKAKQSGKNCYAFYDEDAENAVLHGTARRDDILDIPQGQMSFSENLAAYIFKILYTSPDPKSALTNALGIICRHFDASRAYILEYDASAVYASMTCEYCAPDIEPTIHHYQNFKRSQDSLSRFKDRDINYVRSMDDVSDEERRVLLRSQGIISILNCALRDRGRLIGCLGFDECKKERGPLQASEIELLLLLSGILSTFITRENEHRRIEEERSLFESILEHIDSTVYIVHRSTFALAYMNSRLKQFAPGVKTGDTCYRKLLGRDSPCEDCAILAMEREGRDTYTIRKIIQSTGRFCEIRSARLPQCYGSDAYMLYVTNISSDN